MHPLELQLSNHLLLSCHHRQRHQGQRVRGDDADRLRGHGHQDPPHQVVLHPPSAASQPHGHVLPALRGRQPAAASGRRAHGICLRSPAIIYNPPAQLLRPQLSPFFFVFFVVKYISNLVPPRWLHNREVDLKGSYCRHQFRHIV